MGVGEQSYNSQTASEALKVANLHFLQLIFTARLCHRLTAETKSLVKSRETQSTFELDNDIS